MKLVDRLDRVAELRKTNRTNIVRSACIAYLRNTDIAPKRNARDKQQVERHCDSIAVNCVRFIHKRGCIGA